MVLSDGMVHFLKIETNFNKSTKNYLVALSLTIFTLDPPSKFSLYPREYIWQSKTQHVTCMKATTPRFDVTFQHPTSQLRTRRALSP